ncbi:hypothetical protein SNEBB_007611 [Seison nebaliae]|nr:hypothetical protein SNEBB_007611 [Seison nebaliae]
MEDELKISFRKSLNISDSSPSMNRRGRSINSAPNKSKVNQFSKTIPKKLESIQNANETNVTKHSFSYFRTTTNLIDPLTTRPPPTTSNSVNLTKSLIQLENSSNIFRVTDMLNLSEDLWRPPHKWKTSSKRNIFTSTIDREVSSPYVRPSNPSPPSTSSNKQGRSSKNGSNELSI